MTIEALKAAALAGSLAVPPLHVPDLAVLKAGPKSGAPSIVMAIPLKEVAASQSRPVETLAAGGADFTVTMGLADEGELPLTFAQGGTARTWSWAELRRGVEADFPAGRFRFAFEERWLVIAPAAGGAQGRVWVHGLLRRLYGNARRVTFEPVTWAVLVQGDPASPTAVGLLRRSRDADYFVAYRTRRDMAGINWFVSIDGQMFGMRPEKGLLVFYTKPTPQVPDKKSRA